MDSTYFGRHSIILQVAHANVVENKEPFVEESIDTTSRLPLVHRGKLLKIFLLITPEGFFTGPFFSMIVQPYQKSKRKRPIPSQSGTLRKLRHLHRESEIL